MPKSSEASIDDLTQFAEDIVRRAGETALTYYGRGKSESKFDQGLVTEAELNLSEFFRKELKSQFPEHRVLSEVEEDTEYTHEQKRYLWIFDPLDGVANFQAGIPLWGISLAVVENFWPVFGAFHMPATGDMFTARAGGRACRNNQEIAISNRGVIDDESVLLIYSRFHHAYHSSFPGKIRNLGCTAAHICYVAMGRADAAFITNESYQDLAAAQIIVEAAGGEIFKMDGGRLYLNEYLDGQKIDDHLLALAPDILAQVQGCLKKGS